MPNTRTFNRSFAGGEMSPEMWGRIDDVKFQTGAATVRNFITTPQGPAENRPGFAFVREVKDSTKKTRLIPFTYSTTQTMVIELGAGYFRFHTQGGTLLSGGNPYEIVNPYAEADLFDIHYVQSADVLTLVHPNYAPRELRRLGATNWTLTQIDFNPQVPAPSSVTATAYMPASALTGPPPISADTYQDWYYVVTSVGADGITESSASAPAYVRMNLYITGSNNTIAWTEVTGATRYRVYKRQGGIYGYIGQTSTLSLVDDNISPDMGVTPPIYDNDFIINGIQSVTVTNQGSGYGTVYSGGAITGVTVTAQGSNYSATPTLTVSDPTGSGATFTVQTEEIQPDNPLGGYKITGVTVTNQGSGYTDPVFFLLDNPYAVLGTGGGSGARFKATVTTASNTPTFTIADATGSGAELRPVVEGGKITSVIVVNQGLGYTNPTISINFAAGGSSAAFTANLTGASNFPGAVSYFEQRRCFAGSINEPQKLWMTKSGTESNMSYSLPIKDDDRIEFRVAAREANTIRHIVPLTQLLLLTGAAEWRVSPINSDAITPTSIGVRPQSYIGASNVQPSIVNNSLVYCAARGGHVRELGYSWQASGFVTGDLSLRAAHLFDNYEIVDMCYSKAPQPLLWFVSNNGKLLGLTYVPDQQIGAWHWHDTDGIFESCTTVAEGNEDVLYTIVRRTINGVQKRYVERMQTRQISTIENCFFVDCGSTYNGTNTGSTTVTVTGGTTWEPSETLTITSSTAIFSGSPDINDAIVLTAADGTKYRLRITGYISTTKVTARVDKTLGTAFRGAPTASWAFARNSISGLSWLEGKAVSILADGAVIHGQIVTGGTVTLPRACVIVTVGLPYQSDLQTLPLAMNIEGFGQGRYKNVNKAWLRVFQSSGIFIGPNPDNLVEAKQRTIEPYGSPPALKSAEILVMLTPSWADSGQVYVRQNDPLPLTLVGLTLEVSIGG